MKLRHRCKRKARRAFRLADFHADFLKISNLPIKLIAQHLLSKGT
jgi:uncharacterized protein (DUF885 family)